MSHHPSYKSHPTRYHGIPTIFIPCSSLGLALPLLHNTLGYTVSLNAQQSSHAQHPTAQEREFIPQTMQNFPVPHTTRRSYMQSQTPNISRTSTGPHNPSSLARTVPTAQCFCYSSTLQNHPRVHYTPKPLSPVSHRFLQLVVSCATSHAGPGGRQLPELSSPLICFGTWHMAHGTSIMRSCMTQGAVAPKRKMHQATRQRTTGKEQSLHIGHEWPWIKLGLHWPQATGFLSTKSRNTESFPLPVTA